ncbi:Asp-tRNA(Asn)/Glu-tRNA(Gln) amidotransferase subunit GatC [Candidatus Gottesmanbacteria bacterium]|nr:Asp-tRNA(Asn)/Glu-tRNA(Gln) amidotransferase subunit GatC [Candidatus Gottesmanbacteria bacterium]MBI3576555.1 Asp-tRNA(Asn)/Glu-tRNA(Gln) amidotransferase subunit GatC [Candidatus Gottesmanbacteria bacterium]
MKKKVFTPADVKKIAILAHIPVTKQEEKTLADGFSQTISVIDKLTKVDVKNIEPTSQVTGLENVFREDEVEVERMFTQDQALSNANATHNGFFKVDRVLEE